MTSVTAPSMPPAATTAEVVVGYLVTLPGGHECRLGPDRTRADLYAARNHGVVEEMYVRRRGAESGAVTR